jgi:hypothetical protein
VAHELIVHTRITPAGPVIELAGHLDHHSAPQIRALLSALALQPGQLLIVDLARLAFCDSSGIPRTGQPKSPGRRRFPRSPAKAAELVKR